MSDNIKDGKVTAPFTEEQVEALNAYQNLGIVNPFTCCSHNGCKRGARKDDGVLIACVYGWVCPCGRYTQDWARESMLDIESIKKEWNESPLGKISPLT